MKIETTFLRSKVGIRIFVLFVCCALLPVVLLAILSYSQVTRQLKDQAQRRLKQETKDLAGSISERLYFLEGKMKRIAFKSGMESKPTLAQEESQLLKEAFESLIVVDDQHGNTPLFGDIQSIPKLTPEQKQHIQPGITYVFSNHSPDSRGHIFMGTALDPRSPRRRILLGEIAQTYLWGSADELALSGMMELCILDESYHTIFSSFPGPVSFPEVVTHQMSRSMMGQFTWINGGKEYLAGYRSTSFQKLMIVPKWTVVICESKSIVLAPAANFKKMFFLTLLMSLWVVLLFSVMQIRRSLVPLEKLQEGTKRIAAQDFGSPVTIKSGDEFEELAVSFNTMANQLDKQFNILTMLNEIDRAILSATETEKIVGVVLAFMHDISPCERVSVTLLDSRTNTTGRTYHGNGKTKEAIVEAIVLEPEELQILTDHPEYLYVELNGATPHYLAPMVRSGIETFWVLPIILKQQPSGFITLGWSLKSAVPSREDLGRARQLADQMGVALSNAALIRELNEFNWGTLEALGRAIDAKSHWTAGHSERVTKLALKIGRVLELPREEMDVLHRAGLLHDIGKLGIPVEILDKEGKLTRREEQLMREHVRLGLRILEPIAAYNEVISVVSHHHENFSGGGYPDGLAGKDISLGGRIFAVADSFDALTSNRPYRQALDREFAVEMIKQGQGSRYDPDIVQAFLEVMARERKEGET